MLLLLLLLGHYVVRRGLYQILRRVFPIGRVLMLVMVHLVHLQRLLSQIHLRLRFNFVSDEFQQFLRRFRVVL